MAFEAVVHGLDKLVKQSGGYSGTLTVEVHEIQKDSKGKVKSDVLLFSTAVPVFNKDTLDFARKWAIGQVKELHLKIGEHLPIV